VCGPPRFYTALAAARAAGDALRCAVSGCIVIVEYLRAVVVRRRDHPTQGIVCVRDAGGVGREAQYSYNNGKGKGESNFHISLHPSLYLILRIRLNDHVNSAHQQGDSQVWSGETRHSLLRDTPIYLQIQSPISLQRQKAENYMQGAPTI